MQPYLSEDFDERAIARLFFLIINESENVSDLDESIIV
jgi:hypothetical protein